jgi:hypothetical protein
MSVVKRFAPFLVLLALGYTLGYQDAYRGPSSLGWKLGELVDHLTPDRVREARAQNAEALRQQQRESLPAGLP